jgi:hypothetical protein
MFLYVILAICIQFFVRYGKIWRGVQFNSADSIIKEGRRKLLTLPVIGINLNTEVQIQVLSKSKSYPSVLLGAQKVMKGKELHRTISNEIQFLSKLHLHLT